jgi:ABC-2 type transport system permease protein
MSQKTPIADLSYRNYDGPKTLDTARWWVITRNGLRVSFKKKSLWVLFALASLPYLFLLFFLFMGTFGGEMMSDQLGDFRGLLLGAYGSAFWPLMIALMVGAGSIAADNRANALQVYLAKPVTKRDYLIGKWLAIFMVVFGAYFLPMFIVTSYQAFDTGIIDFMKTDGVIFGAMPILAAIPAVLHASLLVGLSAWNKTPWIVGVIYAGLYFFSTIFANIIASAIDTSEVAEATLRHLSIEGIIAGIGQFILNTAPRSLTPGRMDDTMPSILTLLLVAAGLTLAGILLARARIRAVEVVQG